MTPSTRRRCTLLALALGLAASACDHQATPTDAGTLQAEDRSLACEYGLRCAEEVCGLHFEELALECQDGLDLEPCRDAQLRYESCLYFCGQRPEDDFFAAPRPYVSSSVAASCTEHGIEVGVACIEDPDSPDCIEGVNECSVGACN